jgi:hypothetical protein
MSEHLLAADLRQDAMVHASDEDRKFFVRMDDRSIIERVLICTLCSQRVLAYEMAIIANSMKELEKLLVQFGDKEHFIRCVPVMMELGSEGLRQLQTHREDQESAQLEHFMSLFEQHKHELLDIMEDQQGESDER